MSAPTSSPPSLTPRPGSRIAIAGGCGGIGRALVADCVAADLRVTILDLPTSIERHPPPAGTRVIGVDASDEASVIAAIARLQREERALDAAVNLCGFQVAHAPVAELPSAAWDECIAGNLRAAFLLSRFWIPLLREGQEPSLVHVTSGLASYGGMGYGPYAVAKGGMNTLVRALARENAPWLRVNAVAPGYVDTAFSRGGTGRSDESQPSTMNVDAYVGTVPLARVAEPGDIAGPILFLLGPASRFMTGQIVHVNGGAYLP
jgi:3-oxoacyl-[acyl-carrier protein] reductase